jgi:RNA polymerase sigma-70 factor (ECF subfamily)
VIKGNRRLSICCQSTKRRSFGRAGHSSIMDEATFEILYEETARPLWSYVYRVSRNAALADDIVQETYYRFLRAPRVKMNETETKSYLYRIAGNLLRDHWRGKRREGLLAETVREGPAADLATSADNPESIHNLDLERRFEELRPQERALLWLAYVEGNEHKEIARMLGLKEKSIRVLLFRARQKLSALLQPKGRDKEEL